MTQQINLFNPIFLRQEKYFSAKTMVESLTLILIALFAFYAYVQSDVRSLRYVADDVAHQLSDARDRFLKVGGELSPQGRSKLLEAQVARAESEAHGKEALLVSLRATTVGKAGGYSEYFAAFARRTLPGVWLTGFSIGGEQLSIRGRVLHPDLVPVYIRALNKESVLRGRSVTWLKLVAHHEPPGAAAPAAAPSRYVEFELSMPLSVPEPGKEGRK